MNIFVFKKCNYLCDKTGILCIVESCGKDKG